MSDDKDLPPPLPDSLPPAPLEDVVSASPPKKRRLSDKIKSLQKMLNESGGGMYMDSSNPSSPAPPPNQQQPSLDKEPEARESPKLEHITRSRPKRNVRPPSRSSVGRMSSQTSLLETSSILEKEEETLEVTMEEEPPPPIPMSTPPDASPSPPPSDSETSEPELPTDPPPPTTFPPMEPPPSTSPPVDELFPLPTSLSDRPLLPMATTPLSVTSPPDRPPDEPLLPNTSPPMGAVSTPSPTPSPPLNTVSKPSPHTSTPISNSLMQPDTLDIAPTTTTSSNLSTTSHSTNTSAPAKGIVIGSFSDRLKKLREKRAAKSNSNSSLTTPISPLSTASSLRSVTDSMDSSTPHFNGSSLSNSTATQSNSHSKKNTTPFSSSIEPSDAPPEPIKAVITADVVPEEKDEAGIDTDEEEGDLPPAPPPPIPDLPPPTDEADPELTSTGTPRKSHTLTSKVSFRTMQWKDEWKRKSEQLQLDSFKSDNLPVFGTSSTVAQRGSPIPDTKPESFDSLSVQDDMSSTGSAPSLPDSLPPALPEGPPPALPDLPPPDADSFEIEPVETEMDTELADDLNPPEPASFAAKDSPSVHSAPTTKMLLDSTSPPSFRSLETSTPNTNSTQDYSLSVVKLRPKKSSPTIDNRVKRRSAFDALVIVEPTAEEKNEVQFNAEERRKLTIMASRLSSADTDVAQQAWSKQSSLQGTPATNTPIMGLTTESEYFLEPRKLSSSQSTSRSESPAVRARPQSQTGSHQLLPPLSASSHSSTPASIKRDEAGRKHERPLSLHSVSDPPQQIRIISEGTPPTSPDVKYTRLRKEKWSVSPEIKRKNIKVVDDDLAASASTGDILQWHGEKKHKTKPSPLEKTSSLQSFESSSNSPRTRLGLHLVNIKKDQSSKISHPVSPLAASSVSTPPALSEDLLKSSSTLELNSDSSDETAPTQKEVQPKAFKVPLDSPAGTPSTFKGSKSSVASKERVLSQKLPESNLKQELLIQQQLAKVKEQGKMLDFLRKDRLSLLRSLTPKGSPRSRPASLILGTDIYKTEPSQWTEDQVCKWLELVGLGSFRVNFREGKVNGEKLLQMDVKLFDELGIDSPEIREIFLAKIYELSNPSAEEELEDDFLLSVDDYTSEDWKKFEAALSVLKSHGYDDSIEIEPSAVGQFIQTRSHSTPNFAEIDFDHTLGNGASTKKDTERTLSKTTQSFDEYKRSTNQDGNISSHHSSSQQHSTDGTHQEDFDGRKLTTEWVAGLPNIRRKRALTDPIPNITVDLSEPQPSPRLSLPHQLPTEEPGSDPKRKIIKKRSITPRQISIQEDEPLKLSPLQRSTDKRSDRCLVKLYMKTVQEGALYKSFLIAPSTTADELIAMALEKAYLGDNHNPQNYTVWDRDSDTSSRSSFSRPLKPKECPVAVQSQWPPEGSRYLELRLKEGIQLHPTPQKRKTSSALEVGDFEAQIRSLTEEKNKLLRELSVFHSELQDKETIEKQLESLTEEYAATRARYKVERQNNSRTLAEIQGRLQEVSFENTQLKDQLAVTSSGNVSSSVLAEMQTKYAKTVETLKRQLSESIKEKEELARKNVSLEEGVSVLSHASDELKKVSRLLREHQQQLKSVEQKLAEKEEAIHSLRAEQNSMAAKHAATLKETLQAVEATTKQQQELSNQTIKELREHVSRLMAEVERKEQVVLSLKKERDRLTRETEAKDNIAASLEADLAGYRALHNPHTSDNEKVLSLQKSVSTHKTALTTLQSEHDRQTAELKEAESEVSQLRDTLAKKEEQLLLLSSSQEQNSSPLFALLDPSTSHLLTLAEIRLRKRPRDISSGAVPSEVEQSMSHDYGITVSESLGTCVVSEVTNEAAAAGVQTGDRLLEINGNNVGGMSQREINNIFKKHSRAQDKTLKVVVVRPYEATDQRDLGPLSTQDEELIGRYKKLNSSLNLQLDSQAADADKWRSECERLRSEVLKYSNMAKDRDQEFAFLKSSVSDLKSQLEESEKVRVQLRETLDRLGEGLTAENTLNDQVKRLEAENKKLLATIRDHLVSADDESSPTPKSLSELSGASQSDLLSRLAQSEGELARHRTYLEQLLSVVIDQEPQLLTLVGEAQKMRDQVGEEDEYEDSWC